MVAISKSRIKKQQKVYSRNEKSQEQMLLIVLGVLCGIYGLIKIVNYGSGISGSDGGAISRLAALKGVKDHHPHLNLESKSSPLLSESYDAIAQDILNTLQCEALLNKTTTRADMMRNGMYDDVIPQQQQQQEDEEEGGGGGSGDGNNNNNNKGYGNVEQANLLNFDRRLRRKLLQKEKGGGGANTDDGDDSLRNGGGGQQQQQEGRDTNGNAFDDGVSNNLGDKNNMYDDLTGWQGYTEVTAKELFCLAAATTTLSEEQIRLTKQRISCDAAGKRQQALLDVWSSARAQMNEDLLLKTLDLATESSRSMGSYTVNLWSPRNDDGMNYILNQVSNEEESAGKNGNNFYGLSHNLGPDHLYVDVGSCLGITTLAVILQYPRTKVVSVEPAAPNWLMQELNMKCNLDEDQQPTVLLAGVGPHTKETMAAKLLWRPSAVTATRAWTPAEEQIKGEDEELMVQLRPWKTILAEADIHSSHHIDVLHVDCEGCEYNLIPSLSDSEYESIDTVMGELHWGYIPLHKLPSSKRGQLTHERLCQHENFARTAKECCGNLELQVRSSIPGEVLYRDGNNNNMEQAATVKDLINDGLCDDFSKWTQEHHFYEIESDYGWFEMTSVAT